MHGVCVFYSYVGVIFIKKSCHEKQFGGNQETRDTLKINKIGQEAALLPLLLLQFLVIGHSIL